MKPLDKRLERIEKAMNPEYKKWEFEDEHGKIVYLTSQHRNEDCLEWLR